MSYPAKERHGGATNATRTLKRTMLRNQSERATCYGIQSARHPGKGKTIATGEDQWLPGLPWQGKAEEQAGQGDLRTVDSFSMTLSWW